MTALLLGALAKLWPYLTAGAVALFGLLRYRQSIIKGERNKQRAKEADAYERHLQDIERAAHARNSVLPGGVPDDPYDRDAR